MMNRINAFFGRMGITTLKLSANRNVGGGGGGGGTAGQPVGLLLVLTKAS